MTISVQLDFDSGLYEIMVQGHGFTAPAGPRIFRAPPHPDVRFQHPAADDAEKDAAKIRSYLAALPAKKQSKKELREVHA